MTRKPDNTPVIINMNWKKDNSERKCLFPIPEKGRETDPEDAEKRLDWAKH